MPRRVRSWDIFCKVVDNSGDAGVCWRLGRQIAAERGDAVRLWIDDLRPLARMWPGLDAGADVQRAAGVDIQRWTSLLPAVVPRDVVIESFGCDIPDSFVSAMAARTPQPAWINLEHLSAEAWVETHHRLPSPHPRLPLTKHFFFPGFTPRTGGLLREAGLLAQRDALQQDPVAQRAFWRGLDVAPAAAGETRISLFGYPNPAAAAGFAAWAAGPSPVHGIAAEGVLADAIAGFCGRAPAAGESVVRGNLRLSVVPFMPQPDYDRLLWLCDVNFVRGEDSFVRAQWAGRPLVWHLYPQEGGAHRVKLEAFLDRHCVAFEPATAAGVADLFRAWNGEGDAALAWAALESRRAQWAAGARRWAATLAGQPDLLHALAEAVENQL